MPQAVCYYLMLRIKSFLQPVRSNLTSFRSNIVCWNGLEARCPCTLMRLLDYLFSHILVPLLFVWTLLKSNECGTNGRPIWSRCSLNQSHRFVSFVMSDIVVYKEKIVLAPNEVLSFTTLVTHIRLTVTLLNMLIFWKVFFHLVSIILISSYTLRQIEIFILQCSITLENQCWINV